MKIKIKEIIPGCMPEIIKVGDWIDLKVSEDYTLKCPHAKMLHKQKKKEGENTERYRDVMFNYTLLDLGVVIEMPRGYEGILLPRSSSFKKWGIIQANSMGVVDNDYKGPNDVWKMPVMATRSVFIPKGTPIAQFKVQLSQKATIWQKIKWLFSSKVELVKVDEVTNEDRKGIGEGSDKYRTK